MKKIVFLMILSIFCITSVKADEYENEMLIIDDDITIDNAISSSSLIMGDEIEVDNKIEGVGILFANDIEINSSIDYFALFGSKVTFNGIVKDGIIFADRIVLNESSSVGRDIVMFANNVSISGSISRNITVYASHVSIKDAQIAGNVKIKADEIEVNDNAAIIGNLSYNEEAIIEISDIASIGSTDTFVTKVDEKVEFLENTKNKLISMVNVLVVFAILLYFVPKLFNKIELKRKDIVKSIGFGFIFVLLVPIVTLLLIITVFGLSLGVILMAIYLLLLYLSSIVTGYLLGSVIWDKCVKKAKRPYLIGVIGIVLLYVLKIIPVIGPVVSFISILIGVGTILSLYNRKKA